jgi:hypothetical protein
VEKKSAWLLPDRKQTPSSFICTVSQKSNMKLRLNETPVVEPSQRHSLNQETNSITIQKCFVKRKREKEENGGFYDEMA